MKILKNIWFILNKEQKKNVIILQFSIVVISIFELGTVLFVTKFLEIVTSNDFLNYRQYFGEYFFDASSNELIVTLSFIVFLMLTFSLFLSLYMNKNINDVSLRLGHEISVDIFKNLISRTWSEHKKSNFNFHTNDVLVESNRFTVCVILPIFRIISRLFLLVALLVTLIIYEPKVTVVMVISFSTIYYLISIVLGDRLSSNSTLLDRNNKLKVKVINETFSNVRDILLDRNFDHFVGSYEEVNKVTAQAQADNATYATSPKYIIEWMVFFSLLSLVCYYAISDDNSMAELVPLLSLYGLAAFKLLPAMQQIFNSFAVVKGNMSVEGRISEILNYKNNFTQSNFIPFNDEIVVDRVSFSYSDMPNNNILSNVNLNIKKNTTVGFVGPSGSGKSTLIDLVCGLLLPTSGRICSGSADIDAMNSNWTSKVAYVPQDIVLFDTTIVDNITLGINGVDFDRLDKVIRLANLSNLISRLDDGIYTNVGDKGSALSGGEKQRVGIARALYKESEIIVFDEATSALDIDSEQEIIKAINNISGTKTILIIAHRLNAVKFCDEIFVLNGGKLVKKGKFEDLFTNDKVVQ